MILRAHYGNMSRLTVSVTRLTMLPKMIPLVLIGHSSMDNVVAVEQSERLYKKYIDNGVNASFYIWARELTALWAPILKRQVPNG